MQQGVLPASVSVACQWLCLWLIGYMRLLAGSRDQDKSLAGLLLAASHTQALSDRHADTKLHFMRIQASDQHFRDALVPGPGTAQDLAQSHWLLLTRAKPCSTLPVH